MWMYSWSFKSITFKKFKLRPADKLVKKIWSQMTTGDWTLILHYSVLDYFHHNLLLLLHNVSIMLNIKADCETWFSAALTISCATIITWWCSHVVQKQKQWGDVVVKKSNITSTSPVISEASHLRCTVCRTALTNTAGQWTLLTLQTQRRWENMIRWNPCSCDIWTMNVICKHSSAEKIWSDYLLQQLQLCSWTSDNKYLKCGHLHAKKVPKKLYLGINREKQQLPIKIKSNNIS